MQDTIPYVGKNDRHTHNLKTKRDRRASEAMGKAGRSIDGGRLVQEDINDILGLYTQSNVEDLSNNLHTRSAVLQRLNNGSIVYAEYPLAPYSKKEIRPIQS